MKESNGMKVKLHTFVTTVPMWEVTFTPRPSYLRGRASTSVDGLQSRSGRFGEDKISCRCRESNHDLSVARAIVTIPTEPSRLPNGHLRYKNKFVFNWKYFFNKSVISVLYFDEKMKMIRVSPREFFFKWHTKSRDIEVCRRHARDKILGNINFIYDSTKRSADVLLLAHTYGGELWENRTLRGRSTCQARRRGQNFPKTNP